MRSRRARLFRRFSVFARQTGFGFAEPDQGVRMKSNERHVIAKPLTKLAHNIEQTFFRIERANRWQAAAVNAVIAGTSVALVAWLVRQLQEGDLLLFACLGSSAAAVVFAPLAKTNSLRSIVSAYVMAALVCVLLRFVSKAGWLPFPVACFFAVSLPVFAMRLTDTMHPAAIGSALAFVIHDRPPQHAGLLLLAIIGLLTVVKILAYIYLEDLEFRKFGREFVRDYYGDELLVTVEREQTEM